MLGQQQVAWTGDDLWFAAVWNPVAGKWVRAPQPVPEAEGDESRQFEEVKQPTAQPVAEDIPQVD